MTSEPCHSISWEIDFYGCINPTFTCHAPPASDCHGPTYCEAEDALNNHDEPTDYYRPAPYDRNKPIDGPIHVWWSHPHEAWHWKYPSAPYAGPTINLGGLLEHLIEEAPK